MYRFKNNVTNTTPRALPHLLDTDMSNRVITDYRIRGIAYLDCGTYGQVFRIHQADRPEETVLKVLAAQDSSETACRGMIEEAKNEAELVECLDHPNIVKMHMSKAYPNPFQPRLAGYYTMQFEMLQISLDKFVLDCMSNGTLGNRFLIENLMKQIGGALKYMHELRFVHHDIKPDNIMVVNDQVPFQALHFKLIDFGLAQTYSFDTPLESTSDRRFAGTEWYMCQEKLACHPRYTGPVLPYNPYLADVYAFGVTCLECALGFEEQVPNDPQYNSRDETLLRQLAKIPQANHLSEPIRLKLLKMLWKHEKDRSQMHEILE